MKKKVLRREKSANNSGKINLKYIPVLGPKDYVVIDKALDGDAPKEFIKVYSFGTCKRNNTKTWDSYIAKTGEKWYPHESVIEYLINSIGIILGLRMNEVKLMLINGQIRFLSKYFLDVRHELMSHAAEIFGEYLQDDQMANEIANDKYESRKHFTVEFLYDALKYKFPFDYCRIMEDVVKMIVFDAIVGNNDRHFFNWAVITSIKKTGEPPRLAPIYDSARGLTWNWHEDSVRKNLNDEEKHNGKKIVKYIRNGCPRISINGNSEVNHFELIKFLEAFKKGRYLNIINDLCNLESEKKVVNLIKIDFSKYFSEDRTKLIIKVIETRFKILRREVSC